MNQPYPKKSEQTLKRKLHQNSHLIRNRKFLFFLLFIMIFLNPGCISKSQPDKKSFLILIPPLDNSTKNDMKLRLRRIKISPLFSDKNLIYRRSDNNFESDFYNEFLVNPSSVLHEEIKKALENSNSFAIVVDETSRADANLIGEMTVDSLYADLREKPLSVVSITFTLFNEENRILYRTFKEQKISLKNSDASEIVSGYGTAFQKILNSILKEIQK